MITRLNVGGTARHVLQLNAELPAFGFHSSLLWGRGGRHEGHLDPGARPQSFVPQLRRDMNPWRDANAFRRLRRTFIEHRPDVVHTHTAKAGFLGRLAARSAGVRVVVHTFHGHVLKGYFPRPLAWSFTAAERAVARNTDALVSVSPLIRDELLELGIGRPEQWHVMPLSLGIEHLLHSTVKPETARSRLGLPEQGPIVGIVARLAPVKDVECFLDAAALVSRQRGDVTFVVAGDGELRQALEKKVAGLLGSRVRFLGWVTDLETLYASLDVVVLTSRNEGTPAALIEAGAAARPVVATRVGGVPDIVSDGLTGVLVPAREPQSIATQIVRLLDEPELRRTFGEAARQRMAKEFGGSEPVEFVADLYRGLLERKSGGD